MVNIICYLSMIEAPEDQHKFEQIYLRYRDLMYRTAYRILRDPYDAEDAVHQAFIAIIEHLEKFVQIDCPETRSFVVLICERKAIDLLRARRPEQNLPLDEEHLGLEISLPGDHGLADAMAKLPAHYRTVLLLRFDNGYSTAELAKILHLTPSGVRKLIGRARNALEKILKEDDYFENRHH